MTERFERRERKGIHFTQRDREIVQAVFYARYLTSRQVARLFFKNTLSSSCKKRVRYLFDKGYLKKRLVNPSELDIYYLGLQGRHYIAQTVDSYPQDVVDKIAGVGGEGEVVSLMVRHELALSSLYVSAIMQCLQFGWQLVWQNTRMLELQRLGVQPDAYFQAYNRKAFIEFTAVLPSRSEMQRKLDGYLPLLEQRGGVPILWFTTSKAKLEYLFKTAKGWLYQDYILFGLIEDNNEFLTKPIWKWSEQKEPVPFIALKV